MARDRGKLQVWYRQAMLGRIAELRDLRSRVREGEPKSYDEVRKIGQALRGSGATFGFPRLSDAAGLVETSPDASVLRRLEGLLHILGDLTRDERGGEGLSPEWLSTPLGLAGQEPRLPPDLSEAWTEAGRRTGCTAGEIATDVAAYLGIAVADVGNRGRAALRLVPEALVTARRVVPIDEDATTITLAASDPTDLETELEVQRLTGRTPLFAVAPPEMVDALIEELYERPSSSAAPVAAAEAPSRGGTPSAARSADSEASAERGAGPEGGEGAGTEGEERSRGSARPEPVVEGSETPVVSESPDVARPGATEVAPGAATVLVVDDDAGARALIRAVLEKKGWSVLEAQDGLDALERLRAEDSIALVVVDLNMPRMDGLELVWELRDASVWERLPVIVVTGEEDEILETQLLEEGADDYVRKPVDPRLFLARVESTLRRTAV